jgi:hypothetical protein
VLRGRGRGRHFDALFVFGQVDQLEIGGEGLEHCQGVWQVLDEAGHQTLRSPQLCRDAGRQALERARHLFFEFETAWPFLFD